VDLEQILIVWLTYVADNVNARVIQRLKSLWILCRYHTLGNATAIEFLYATCSEGAFRKRLGTYLNYVFRVNSIIYKYD